METERRFGADGGSTAARFGRGRYSAQLALFRRSEELYQQAEARYREFLQSVPRVGMGESTTVASPTEDAARGAAHGLIVLRAEGSAAPEGRRLSATREAEGDARRLTSRQREVAGLIASGLSNRQIAERLVLETGTVANHVEHILDRLNLRNRAQFGMWAVQHGIFDPSVGDVAAPDESRRPRGVAENHQIVPRP